MTEQTRDRIAQLRGFYHDERVRAAREFTLMTAQAHDSVKKARAAKLDLEAAIEAGEETGKLEETRVNWRQRRDESWVAVRRAETKYDRWTKAEEVAEVALFSTSEEER